MLPTTATPLLIRCGVHSLADDSQAPNLRQAVPIVCLQRSRWALLHSSDGAPYTAGLVLCEGRVTQGKPRLCQPGGRSSLGAPQAHVKGGFPATAPVTRPIKPFSFGSTGSQLQSSGLHCCHPGSFVQLHPPRLAATDCVRLQAQKGMHMKLHA